MGSLPISNVQAFIANHPETFYIICRDYSSSHGADSGTERNTNGNFDAKHHSESIIPVRRDLVSAMRSFAEFVDGDGAWGDSSCSDSAPKTSPQLHHRDGESGHSSSHWLANDGTVRFASPYLSIYHTRGDRLDSFVQSLPSQQVDGFCQVVDHILHAYGEEYREVDDLIAKLKISYRYLPYLFRPGAGLVQGHGDQARGYACVSWLELSKLETALSAQELQQQAKTQLQPEGGQMSDASSSGVKRIQARQVKVWHWGFDGHFDKRFDVLTVQIVDIDDNSPRNISDLDTRPLEHADVNTRERLRIRGEWLWKCRHQHMITYRDAVQRGHHSTGERHMIDVKTYRELHHHGAQTQRRDQLDSELLVSDNPPDGIFVYLAPLSLKGFNLKTKKWVDLLVDRFSEVEWNTSAFESLVLHKKTKNLLRALISNQIEADMSTDIISGKGNGIIMLLHGGPGTGKTLTAESVAEIARKPLYPVTCGDIGTEPRDVEKYLESVLYLGKTWGCVVLLDEADVFLEQRSLDDLKRNALVSVFLRVLESYDGILVLTSNRVGTFDEAFKSRIQLAIHYANLATHQRIKIWGNFFDRLKTLEEEGIDLPDLEDHVEKLAQHNMNGREIRNVITTARQVARWERKQQREPTYKLNYKAMEEIIETAAKFDTYIRDLNRGMSQDELAEHVGLRAAEPT